MITSFWRNMKQLPLAFFARNTIQVAQDLLGKIISVNGILARIVETEAYGRDPASHAYTRTERSRIMYDTYGHVYVYLIYGMYWCVNFTTEKNDAGAVLIRAVEPLSGIETMKKRRKTDKITNLCSGPGKLCQALAIDRRHNGLKLGAEVKNPRSKLSGIPRIFTPKNGDKYHFSGIKVYDDGFVVPAIASSSRIGITDALDLPWRFFIPGNEFVSKVKFPLS